MRGPLHLTHVNQQAVDRGLREVYFIRGAPNMCCGQSCIKAQGGPCPGLVESEWRGVWDSSLADQTVRNISLRQGTFGASERLEDIVDWLDSADVHFNSLWFQKDPAGYSQGLCLSRSERDTLGRGQAPLLFSRTGSSH
ncbi:unnamed protein product [Leuciscus chuanchicus]